MLLTLSPSSLDDYRTFLRVKSLPTYRVVGIGSEGYVSLKLGRRFYGCEIKDEYHRAALVNCDRAVRSCREKERTLFDAPA